MFLSYRNQGKRPLHLHEECFLFSKLKKALKVRTVPSDLQTSILLSKCVYRMCENTTIASVTCRNVELHIKKPQGKLTRVCWKNLHLETEQFSDTTKNNL